MKFVLEVRPRQGIGPIDLGMTREKVYDLLGTPHQPADLEWLGHYHIEFKADKVVFIEVADIMADHYFVLYKNIDLFKTEASLLVELLSKDSSCKDEDNGFSYLFSDLQLALWRSDVFTYNMITTEELFLRGEENMMDDMRRLYFETVCVYEVGYYG